MKKRLLVSCICLLTLAVPFKKIIAEKPLNKPAIIKGQVVDATKKVPLEFANIVLKRVDDSTMTNATYSGKTGEFILAGIPAGTYYLRISYVGYETKTIPDIEVASSLAEIDLQIVSMVESSVNMGGVTVEAERPTEEFHLDKKVINVSQSPQATGGTALDVLRNQPSVQVDASDNVTLRGSSTFTVLVNGRPSVFQGADALKQIPANIIDNIELITNPSAKYEAEGAAGIININLKKQAANDTRGILNLSTGTRDKYSGDMSLNYNLGAVNLSGGIDYNNNTYWQTQDIERTATINNYSLVNNAEVDRRDRRNQYNVRLGAEYNINDFNVLSLTGSVGRVDITRRFIVNVHNTFAQNDDYSNIHNDFELGAPYLNTVLYYKHSFEPKISELSLENNYTRVRLPYTQGTDEFLTDESYSNRLPNPLLRDRDTENWRYENTVKLDYFYQFSKDSKVELGGQSRLSYRQYDVNNSVFDWSQNAWMVDTLSTNKFDFDNNIHAGYATYSNSIFDIGIQLGLRAEYMDRLLKQKTINNDYAYDKVDWFPSVNISRSMGRNQLQFSYSRRINRPGETILNPFPYYSDSYLTVSGNPELLPEYINSYELNYQWVERGAFFSAQTYYRSSTNAMWRAQSVTDDGMLISTFGNFAETTSMGVELSSSYTVTKWLRLDPNVNLFNYALKGAANTDEVDTDSFTWTARLNTTFTLSQSTLLQLTGMYMSKQISPISEVDPRFYMSVVARQSFYERAFTVTLRASNLFTTAYYDVLATGSNFTNRFLIKPEVPSINLTLSFNFNNYRRNNRGSDDVDVNIGG